MAIQAMERDSTGKGWLELTEEEKADMMRVIDECEFVSMVLKYKGPLMPEDLVQELTWQNTINLEIISQVMQSVSRG
ncbi:MAG: hypothetical protein C0399_05900 [Syntrophus sp. (in: bacteria)]|nr:hypothetical protein [Syntrophus sp. (in: bacteria)]